MWCAERGVLWDSYYNALVKYTSAVNELPDVHRDEFVKCKARCRELHNFCTSNHSAWAHHVSEHLCKF